MPKSIANVLIVEDDDACVRLYAHWLLKENGGQFSVEVVSSLAQAVERLARPGVDAVLLDLNLPDSAGLDTLDHVLAAACGVPVVVLTAEDAGDVAVKALRHGAQDSLSKNSARSETLVHRIRFSLERNVFVRELAEHKRRMESIIESAFSPIVTIDERGAVLSANKAAMALMGVDAAQIQEMNISEFMPEPHRSAHAQYIQEYLKTGKNKVVGIRREVVLRRLDGSTIPIDLYVSEVVSGETRTFTGIFHDLSDRKAAERRILENNIHLLHLNQELTSAVDKLGALASTDSLTGLGNRKSFDDRLALEWRRARRDKTPLALLMLDIDCFKRLNDARGHLAGDEALKATAKAIAGFARRPGDLAARYGGEEFVVMLPATDSNRAQALAERVRMAVGDLHLPNPHSSAAPFVTVSVGVASMIPTEKDVAADLIRSADDALYQAKSQGRNRVILFEPQTADSAA